MVAATLVLAGAALTQTQPAVDEDTDSYIVVLEEEGVDHPSQVASGIEQRQDLEVGFVYSNALEGFSAEIPDQALAAVRANPRVAYIERDRLVHTIEQTLPWGINRIDADKSTTAAIDGVGRSLNVNAYIIDTGIDKTHSDLNVVDHVNFHGGKNADCNGHGTHVAGTVAAEDDTSDVVGAAPDAPLIGVKVIGCNGSGRLSNVIKGVDWVTANAKKPAIANVSLSTGASLAFDRAVKRSANSGVFYSVAAGNDGSKACNYSPARAGAGTNNGIVTTAATMRSNEEPRFSNYGRCVDLWAPGTQILSTKLGGGTATKRGTSMAAPHAAGTAALYLSSHSRAAPSTVEGVLKADSKFTGTKSKNGRRIRLVYAGGY
jgi:subtilisin family serine protease